MKKLAMFSYSVICYLVGFASLLFWILSISHLVPEISIDREPQMAFSLALLKNTALVLLFAVPHSLMARPFFKEWITKILPRPIERSTYVLQAGILLFVLIWNWEPMGGEVWSIAAGTPLFYFMYTMFFLGWTILFISTFLINHFDLFGLRQTFLELQNKPYTPLNFKVIAFYKYTRHPLYLGGIIGLWFTPVMSATHLVFAILLTGYFFIGAMFEEVDLRNYFGKTYEEYARRTPMMIPFTKWIKRSRPKVNAAEQTTYARDISEI